MSVLTVPRLQKMLMRHEGLRLRPYICPSGKLSIGFGRNLDDVGISKSEALILLQNDIVEATKCAQSFKWFWELPVVRQDVIVAMIFNMGLTHFLSFHKMIAAIERKNYPVAAEEMRNSKWASQVGKRATELAKMMETAGYVVP